MVTHSAAGAKVPWVDPGVPMSRRAPWASHLGSLGLSLFVCEMGPITALATGFGHEVEVQSGAGTRPATSAFAVTVTCRAEPVLGAGRETERGTESAFKTPGHKPAGARGEASSRRGRGSGLGDQTPRPFLPLYGK